MAEADATINDIFGYWGKQYDKLAKQAAAAVGADPATFTFGERPKAQRTAHKGTGLEHANALITNDGLVMTQDLPATTKRNENAELERWGRHHDKLTVICYGGTLPARVGWELYQASVQFELKDVADDPGWTEALERNRLAGGSLELPIFLQGDRIYWGQRDDELHEMIRSFRQNQSARLDAPPDLVKEHYGTR